MMKHNSMKSISQIVGIEVETYEKFLIDVQKDPELRAKWELMPQAGRDMIRRYYDGEELPPFTQDQIFKHIFNPETHPERLSELLSLLIGRKLRVLCALPLENIQLSLYSKQIILDILVELEDGSLANVEMQRIALDFSAKRAAVLSSSLIMRQYSVLKEQKKAELDYNQIQKVYTVVLMESNHPDFAACQDHYVHKARQRFDTPVEMDLMQEYVFVELKKFNQLVQAIDTELDAWLKFLIVKTPTDIMDIIAKFSDFQNVYKDAILFLDDKGGVLNMVFQTITELDENSLKRMVTDRDAIIKQKEAELEQKETELEKKETELEKKNTELAKVKTEKEAEIRRLKEALAEKGISY